MTRKVNEVPQIEVADADSVSMGSEEKEPWKNLRKGFKTELILTLIERGFSVREAGRMIDTIFSEIKQALLRKETVEIEGFGCWQVKKNDRARGWRFGKVTHFKPYRIAFDVDREALANASSAEWAPHPAWAAQRKAGPKLRGRKLAALLQQKERERRARLLADYTRLIVRFIWNELYCEDWRLFWTLRHEGWFYGPASEVPVSEAHTVDVYNAANLIKATKPRTLFERWPNGTIAAVGWYACWSARLKVELDLWRKAEEMAADITLRGRRLLD